MNNMYHSANCVLMVKPYDFQFNEQTAVDNEFMKRKDGVTEAAIAEFDASVEVLRNEGIHVIVLNEPEEPTQIKCPDAVFPNNWFGSTRDGQLIVYTMATENRRAETERLRDVQQLLANEGFEFHDTPIVLQEHMSGTEVQPDDVLEGTGAFVIDHLGGTVYAAKSCRCSPKALKKYMEIRSDLNDAVMFETKSSNGKEIYHANVMLSIGTNFAVVCADSIVENPQSADCMSRTQVLKRLGENRTVIEITHEQAERFFCANILEVRSANDESKIVMSCSAYNGFTEEQRALLSQFGKLVALPIDNAIEYVGGGSARCMLAEVFLPKKQAIRRELERRMSDAIFWYMLMQQSAQSVQTQQEVSPIMDSFYDSIVDTVAV